MSSRTFLRIRPLAAVTALAALGLMLAACATTQVGAQWMDPAFQGQSLRGARLLVVCDAGDPVMQRICQDEVSAQVKALGATPVQAPDAGANGRPAPAGQLMSAARLAGARAVFSTSVSPDASVVTPGPAVSFGLGGFSWGSGVGGGVGVTVPTTGAQVSTAYAASGVLTDVASGRMMWSAKATTPAQSNINAQMAELARAVVGAAQQAGLF
jgi:hypothetical protein